jgi:hypothetical protein
MEMVRKKAQEHSSNCISDSNPLVATVNMVIIVTTQSQASETVTFKEREPLKGKGPLEWQEEEWIRQLMVYTVREIQAEEAIQNSPME